MKKTLIEKYVKKMADMPYRFHAYKTSKRTIVVEYGIIYEQINDNTEEYTVIRCEYYVDDNDPNKYWWIEGHTYMMEIGGVTDKDMPVE